MSGNNAQIAIKVTASSSAATKEIDALNKRIADLSKQNDAMGKGILRLSGRSAGLGTLSAGMRGLAHESSSAFESIGRLVPQLGLITSAASLAGIAALTDHWANMGTQILNASHRTGVAVGTLSTMQAAARLAGASSEAMSSGIKNLTDNLTNLSVGRAAPETAAAFAMLHIAVRNADGSIRSAADAMPDIADKIASIKNPTIQAQYATMLLGDAGEALLPYLRLGKAGIEDYNKKAREYGLFNKAGADAADELRRKQTDLTLSVEGLGYSIAEQLAPVLGPMIESFADWIKQNRGLIGQDVAGWVTTISDDAKALKKGLDPIVDKFGGWKTVIEGIIAIELGGWALRMVAGLSPLTLALAGIVLTIEKIQNFEANGLTDLKAGSPLWSNVPDQEQSNYVNSPRSQAFLHPNGENPNPFSWYNPGSWLGQGSGAKSANPADPGQLTRYFQSKGWSNNQIAGILGNFQGESGLNAANIGDNGAAAGLGMWRDGRRQAFHRMYGHDVSEGTAMEQAEFTQWELTHTEKAAGDALRASKTAQQAGIVVSELYERPLDVAGNAALRGQYADTWAGKIAAMQPVAQVTPDLAELNRLGGAPANINGGTGAASIAPPGATINGSADVNVRFHNAPPGTTTTASTDGKLFSPPRVEQSMPNNGLGGLY